MAKDPIITTSANISGKKPATNSNELNWLPEDVFISDWQGEELVGKSLPSTILKAQGNDIELIRRGAWSIEALIPLLEKLEYNLK